MRLKKLILHGFKSFADRTEFVFDAPITGIVGPNGCGKSNVVDGFKWVLGEQSAKSLRGEAMMDVIFNGSGGGRKPAGVAEVTLVFENPRREDGTRTLHLDADEVSVGRRLYRDGTSEYHVNNKLARLKDVRELFLDTGVGVDAYSVIEQGRVSALLEANPDERRLIFEEAAGISKFKQRKKESQRKLEKVDQNLLRVNDIVEEVDKRLRSVKIQAGRARTYKEYSERLGELRLTYALHDYHVQHGQLADLEAKREDAQFRLDDAAGDLAKRQNELVNRREQHEGLARQRQQAEYELVQAQAAMESAVQRQEYARRQLQQIAEQVEAFRADKAQVEQKLAEVTESLAAETGALEKLTAELEQHRRLIDERQAAFKEEQLQLHKANQDLEQNKAAILDLMRKLASLGSRIGAIEIEQKNIAAHQERLADRRRVVVEEIERLEAQQKEQQQKLDEAVTRIAERQAELERCRQEAAQLGRQIAQTSEQLGAAREHRSGMLSRQKLLQDLEARREGVSEGVKSVLRQREKDQKFSLVRGLVADVLRVDVEHAHVIEAALDGRDQLLVTDDSAAALAAADALNDLEGRVSIACTDELASRGNGTDDGYDWNRHPQRIRLAIDLLRFEPTDAALARHLLGRTVVVDDLAAARELHMNGPAGWRYVTTLGEVIEADGTLRAGPLTAAMGLLSRHAELEALAQQIAEVDARIAHLARQLTEGNTAARSLEEQQNVLRNEVYRANTAKVELSSAIAQINDRKASLRREQPVLERELAALVEQVGRLTTEHAAATERRQAMEADQAARQQRVDELTATQQRLAEEIRQTGEQLTAERVLLGQTQEKQLASQQQVQRQTAARAELAQQVQRLEKSAEAVAARRGGVERELEVATAAEQALEKKQEALAAQVEKLAGQVAEAAHSVQALVGQVESLRGEHGEIEQELHAVQLRLGETKVRLETLVQRTLDELQLDLPARYAELTAPRQITPADEVGAPPAEGEGQVAAEADESAAPAVKGAAVAAEEEGQQQQELFAPAAGYDPGDTDWDAVAEEIKVLKDKLHRLGNVNLDAISEQDELEQRQQFMAAQLKDLSESKRQLEELIRTINEESGLRFERTFNAVREHFQAMFRKLFGGGKADIFLETEIEEAKGKKGAAKGEAVAVGDTGGGGDGELAGTPAPERKKVDILEAGIEIIARPPGKQPVSISQLSGGEKTMTCVALLMSIFKSKPSPFCILDEVDAALDEANNQRFNLIVQEFLEQSQFIIITHSKRTMTIAEQLYGVTMQEQGVSKRVAVKFDQVDSQGRINEQAAA